MNSARIVVIGAGPSGIAAATKLLELGFEKVSLLEAENRIGGRIHTVPFADNVVDMGAEWCHGEKDNVVYELASKLNLLESTGNIREKYESIRSNKERLPDDLNKRLKTILSDIIAATQTELVDYKGSLGSYFTDKFGEALRKPENSDIDVNIAQEFFDNYMKVEKSSEAAETLNDVSCKSYLEYWDSEGDSLLSWKGKGYLRFLQILMKSSEDRNDLGVLDKRVQLGKRVQQIQWGDEKKSVSVKCEDGEVIEADHVITTVSLGVLKAKHRDLFEPNLPKEKIRAIENIGFGIVGKFFIEFSEKFWPDDWIGVSFLWREEDVDEIRGTENAWLEDVFGFYIVKSQPRLLSGWITGPSVRHMETLPEDVVLNGCLYLLRRFLKWDIPTPIGFKRSIWFHNENFRGTYSYISIMAEKANTGAKDLLSPLKDADGKPILLFAGEASNEHRFSTVHGAVETGWREAQRLAEFYDTSSKSKE